MTHYPERPERPVAALRRPRALLGAAGTVPLRPTDAVALLAYRARLEVRYEGCDIPAAGDNQPVHIGPPYRLDPDPEWRHHTACEAGPDAAAMLQLLSFGHTAR